MSNQSSKKMEKDFDFNRIGKRMPYKTPDNFFNELETGIWEKVRDTSPEPARRKNIRLRLLLGAAAVAAVQLDEQHIFAVADAPRPAGVGNISLGTAVQHAEGISYLRVIHR